MGYYLNIDAADEATALNSLGKKIPLTECQEFDGFSGTNALICMFENGVLPVIGVLYSSQERDRCLTGVEGKDPEFWLIPKDKMPTKQEIPYTDG